MRKLLKDRKNTILFVIIAFVIVFYTYALFRPVVEMQESYESMSQEDEDIPLQMLEEKREVELKQEEAEKNELDQNVLKIDFKPDAKKLVNDIKNESKHDPKRERQFSVRIDKNKVAYLRKPIFEQLVEDGANLDAQQKNTEEVKSDKVSEDDNKKQEESNEAQVYPKVTFFKKPKYVDYQMIQEVSSDKKTVDLSHEKHGDITMYSKPKYNFYTIRMHNLNTGEYLATVFFQNGEYSAEGLKKINKFLRDYRTGEVKRIDPKLIMLVYKLVRKFNYDGYISVISGYRSVKTQNMLRRKGRNVAKSSMHSVGKAIDIKIPGVSTAKLRDAAKAFRAGGVGFYPRDGFVHVDTGTLRSW